MMSRTLLLSDGQPIRVMEAGQGAPLLLLHGVGMRAEAWGPQMADLSRHARVIAVDLPGHGESAALAGQPLLPDYVAWGARVVRALGLGPVSVAGHSMGALVALGLAVDHPDLVTRAALLNPVFRRSAEARAAVLARAAEIAGGQGMSDAPLSRWFSADQGDLRDQVAGWLRTVPQAGYAAAYRAFAEGDTVYAGRVSAIRCPLLVLTGAQDANSTPAMTQAIAALAPQARAVVIDAHRHMVNLTAPERVSQELSEWLSAGKVAA